MLGTLFRRFPNLETHNTHPKAYEEYEDGFAGFIPNEFWGQRLHVTEG